jgi:hypothetical protein
VFSGRENEEGRKRALASTSLTEQNPLEILAGAHAKTPGLGNTVTSAGYNPQEEKTQELALVKMLDVPAC